MDPSQQQQLITEAIQKARYNEIVQVTVTSSAQEEDHNNNNRSDDNGDGDTKTSGTDVQQQQQQQQEEEEVISLVACLDYENGGIVWNPLLCADDDLILARHLQTKRWMFPMLNDHRRNRMYETAIQHAVQELAQRYKNKNVASSSLLEQQQQQKLLPTTIHALDIGSGTGLLGMMLRKHLHQALLFLFLHDNSNGNNNAKKNQSPPPQAPIDVTSIKVTSIEMASFMAQIARQTIQDNATPLPSPPPPQQQQAAAVAMLQQQEEEHQSNTIPIQHFLTEGHSRELPPVSPPAILCVSELLEDGLLGEGIIPTLRDVWERHMDRSAAAAAAAAGMTATSTMMIPQRARVMVQLVSSHCRVTPTTDSGVGDGDPKHQPKNGTGWLLDYYGPHAERVTQAYEQYATTCGEDKVHNNNAKTPLTAARFTLDANESQLLLDASNVVLPVHGGKLLREKSLIALTEPTRVLEFDFGPPNNDSITQSGGCHSCQITVPATRTGKIEGALVWWELDLWHDVTYSTRPLLEDQDEDWQDHWHNCLHVFSQTQTVSEGDSLTARISHTDERIFVELLPSAGREGNDSSEPVDSADSNKRLKIESSASSRSALISPMRAYQLNDVDRTATWLQAIASALLEKGKSSLVLDLSDFCWCACLAASLGATNVVSVESSTNPEMALTSARVAQVANGFPADKSRFDILQCHTEQLSLELLGGQPAGIVVAEYYQVLEGWHLQEALNFFNIVRSLRKRRMISRTARVLPGRCRIMACAIESVELRSAYKACGDTESRLMGFDHKYINKLGGDFSQFDLVLPMWQYEYTRLSENVELAYLDFERSCDDDGHHLGQVFASKAKFTRKGNFDAVMVWVEFEFHSLEGSISLHTCRPGNLQLIRMAKQSEEIFDDATKRASLECYFRFTEDVFQTHDIKMFVKKQNSEERYEH